MRIVLTSDLHYDVARSRQPTEDLARRLCRNGGDVLVFVGDSAAADLAILERCFGLFESFRGPRLFTPGNHDLWVDPESDSRRRYAVELPAVCARSGVHYLDDGPFFAGDCALVGNIGWYDYTFRAARLGIPLRFYRSKVAPGAAALLDGHRHLVEGYDDVPLSAGQIAIRWMDGVRVRLDRSDVAFTQEAAGRLRAHLALAAARVRRIVVGVHHLPWAELVPRAVSPAFAFASAFLGSELLGETVLEFPQVTHVYCGHSHRRVHCRKRGVEAVSIGSSYTVKEYEVLDV